jgi:hypothetical protein
MAATRHNNCADSLPHRARTAGKRLEKFAGDHEYNWPVSTGLSAPHPAERFSFSACNERLASSQRCRREFSQMIPSAAFAAYLPAVYSYLAGLGRTRHRDFPENMKKESLKNL